MELEKLINADIKAAMLAKDSQKLAALRAIKAAILLAKTDKKSGGDDIAEEAEMQILKRLVKQRKESAALYTETGRDDLVKEELFQASVIEAYLPEQLSEEIIREEVKKDH